jgi:glutamine amidotransferase
MVVIVDYGIGNLRSIQSKIQRLHFNVTISRLPDVILSADRLILPGVGFFSNGMQNLRNFGLIPVLEDAVLVKKKPILGICLGMQLFTQSSEEGNEKGLGWIPALTRRFRFSEEKSNSVSRSLRVPHVGWNTVSPQRENLLFRDIPLNTRFYFTHSYFVSCESSKNAAATTDYGVSFAAAVQKDNIYGTQFHPEKSHQHGLRLIENFLRYS